MAERSKSTDGPYPSIVGRKETMRMPSGQEVKLVQAVFDFVELDNGMKVPLRIHSYYGTLPEQQNAYFIQQWRGA